jgi:predicted transcriptional regulator
MANISQAVFCRLCELVRHVERWRLSIRAIECSAKVVSGRDSQDFRGVDRDFLGFRVEQLRAPSRAARMPDTESKPGNGQFRSRSFVDCLTSFCAAQYISKLYGECALGRPKGRTHPARVSVALTPAQFEAISSLAQKESSTVSWIVRRAVVDFIARADLLASGRVRSSAGRAKRENSDS